MPPRVEFSLLFLLISVGKLIQDIVGLRLARAAWVVSF